MLEHCLPGSRKLAMPVVMKVMKAKAVNAVTAMKKNVFKSQLSMKSVMKSDQKAMKKMAKKAVKKNLKQELKVTGKHQDKKGVKNEVKKATQTAMKTLTASALVKHAKGDQGKDMTLDQKMELFRKDKIDKDEFNTEDRHKLWDRFHKALAHSPDEANSFKSLSGPGV